MYLVVLFHSEVYLSVSPLAVSPYVAAWREPLFFFISGYLFTSDRYAFSLRHKAVQVLTRLVWTYFIFTTIVVLPKTAANGTSLWEGVADILTGRASWFIAALCLSEMMWALMMNFTKRLSIYAAFMLFSLAAGACIRMCGLGSMPYWFDCALLVNFYVGLGYFYRLYEGRISRALPPSVGAAVMCVLVYFGLMMFDKAIIGTNCVIFFPGDHQFFPLAVFYSAAGIVMAVTAAKALPASRILCFVGMNSLVFYYLNGGVVRVLSAACGRIGLTDWIAGLSGCGSYAFVVLISLCASGILSVAAAVIARYAPVLAGDREAIKRLLRRAGVKV